MTVRIFIEDVELSFDKVNFSDGGSNLKLKIPEELEGAIYPSHYCIEVGTDTPVDNYLWEILQAVDVVEKTFGDRFISNVLVLPYLPHARADRIFEKGNGFPLDLFLRYVSGESRTIVLTDPHSDYYKKFETWGKFEVKTQEQCFMETCGDKVVPGDILVAPDKGALNKIYKIQKALSEIGVHTSVVEANKKRCLSTGRIISTELPDYLYDNVNCWIVDDLVDGGGTFIPLAQLLKQRNSSNVNLYITHGIFSRGLDSFKGVIDNIYTYQTICNYVTESEIKEFSKGD